MQVNCATTTNTCTHKLSHITCGTHAHCVKISKRTNIMRNVMHVQHSRCDSLCVVNHPLVKALVLSQPSFHKALVHTAQSLFSYHSQDGIILFRLYRLFFSIFRGCVNYTIVKCLYSMGLNCCGTYLPQVGELGIFSSLTSCKLQARP